jgi:hypothetical protein
MTFCCATGAVSGSRMALVQADIPTAQARKVVEVSGFYVVPGLIDLRLMFSAMRDRCRPIRRLADI